MNWIELAQDRGHFDNFCVLYAIELIFYCFDWLTAESRWEQLQPSGERPPCLQEHSAVAYKDNIYVFGGEVGFSAGTETPLWVYHVKVSRPCQNSVYSAIPCIE